MEREKATRLLAKKLVEISGRDIISDKSHKDKLVNNSDFVYAIGDSKIIDYHRDHKKYYSQGGMHDGGKEFNGKSIEEVLMGIIPDEANYLFASEPVQWGDYHLGINIVPYAIIGKEERSVIKERFYKGDDLEIRDAVESLNIENFFLLYNIYSTRKFLTLYNLIDTLSQNRVFIKAIFQNEHKHVDKFKNVIKEQKDIDIINYLIKTFGLNPEVFTMDSDVCTQYFGSLMKHLKKYSDFFHFVFNIPSEDQDVETNKLLLKSYPSLLSIDTILFKEYLQGNNFIEYFKVLEAPQKENVVNLLKGCKPKYDGYDSFLFEIGFKDVMNLSDYRFWYRDNPKHFIDAFKGEGRKKKVVILKEIYESDAVNEEVIRWLNENELDLVREVGLSP